MFRDSTDRKPSLVLIVSSPMAVNVLLCPQLPSLSDWQLTVVCAPGEIRPEVSRSATVIQTPLARGMDPFSDIRSIRNLRRLLARLRPDVVVAGTPKGALVGITAARLAGVPNRVFHVRGARWDGMIGWRRRALVAVDRFISWNATQVLAVSHSLADLMVTAGACVTAPIVLGYGGSKGVDTEIFHARGRTTRPMEGARLGFLGRLTEDKGLLDAYAVFDAVKKDSPHASLHVIGELDEVAPLPPAQLERLRTDPGIRWEQRLSHEEVADRMRSWDLLVFPSRREGLPNAVIEAAACGVPSVGYDVTGVRNAIEPGVSGEFVLPDRVGELAAAAQRVLVPEQHQSFSRGALGWAANFASTKVQTEFARYLATVAGVLSRDDATDSTVTLPVAAESSGRALANPG